MVKMYEFYTRKLKKSTIVRESLEHPRTICYYIENYLFYIETKNGGVS